MKRNLYKFAAAKNAAMMVEINNALYEGDRLRSFDEFKAELDRLNIQYNKNYLEAEYRTARQSGHMAQKWQDIVDNKELFPNLEYRTQGDDRVRPEHEKLNGIIAPIDHPFWAKYYPPNGWRCRCDAVQTAGDPTVNIPDSDPGVKPEFEVNVGKSGQVFNEDSKNGHRYFALAKEDPQWPKRFELSKLEAGYEKMKTPKSNSVKVNIYAEDNKRNFEVANKVVDDLGLGMKIRPHIDGQIILNHKNPEYEIAGKLADRKSPTGRRLRALWRSAVDQNCTTIVFDMENYHLSKADLLATIKITLNEPKNYPTITEVIIIPKDGNAEHYLRKDL